MQAIEGNLAPGQKWCKLFLSVYKSRPAEGITEDDVAAVQLWSTRGEEMRRKAVKDKKLTLLLFSPVDAAARAKSLALYKTHPRRKLKDLEISLRSQTPFETEFANVRVGVAFRFFCC